MKITGKNWIKIEGAEGTKKPMYIKGSAEGTSKMVYLQDTQSAGYVRRRVGGAWIYMSKEDAENVKKTAPTNNPITNLVAQREQLQAELNASQAELSARQAEDAKREAKRLAAAKARLARRVAAASQTPQETTKQKIARLEEEKELIGFRGDSLAFENDSLQEENQRLQEEIQRLQEEAERLRKEFAQSEAYAEWQIDQLTTENEVLKGQNNNIIDATKAIGLREGYLAHPEIGNFVDKVAAADEVEISSRTVVKENGTEIVLRAKTKDTQK